MAALWSAVLRGGDPPADHRTPHRPPKRTGRFAVATVLAVATALLGPLAPARAAGNPYQHGPDPTAAEFAAPAGPYSVASQNVSAYSVSGFGGGVVYYPTGAGSTTFGVVAMMPGFLATASKWSWLAPRVASEGFVVIAITPSGIFDSDAQRAMELRTALTWVVSSSAARSESDPNRLAVMGHSMGGGASLRAAAAMPSLKAAIPISPWDQATESSGITVPTEILVAQDDTSAPPDKMAIPYYDAIPPGTPKGLVIFAGGDHNSPLAANDSATAEYTISWLKRFVDNDTRYEQFLCPGPVDDSAIASYQATCPL